MAPWSTMSTRSPPISVDAKEAPSTSSRSSERSERGNERRMDPLRQRHRGQQPQRGAALAVDEDDEQDVAEHDRPDHGEPRRRRRRRPHAEDRPASGPERSITASVKGTIPMANQRDTVKVAAQHTASAPDRNASSSGCPERPRALEGRGEQQVHRGEDEEDGGEEDEATLVAEPVRRSWRFGSPGFVACALSRPAERVQRGQVVRLEGLLGPRLVRSRPIVTTARVRSPSR